LISSVASSLGELTSEVSVLLQKDTNSIQYHFLKFKLHCILPLLMLLYSVNYCYLKQWHVAAIEEIPHSVINTSLLKETIRVYS
jgi:hypothetical protein